MRYLILLAFILSLPAVTLAESEPHYTEAQFRAALKDLRGPLSPKWKDDAKVIITFTGESPDIEIVIGPPILAVLDNADPQGDPFLAAFAGGQGEAQIDAHHKGGFVLAGAHEIFDMYKRIRAAKPKYHNAGVERLLEADKAGNLEKILTPPEQAQR